MSEKPSHPCQICGTDINRFVGHEKQQDLDDTIKTYKEMCPKCWQLQKTLSENPEYQLMKTFVRLEKEENEYR